MKEKTVCIIGHQEISGDDIVEIKSFLVDKIVMLLMDGYTRFSVGDRMGFDMLALKTLIELKEVFSNLEIKLNESIGHKFIIRNEADEKAYQKSRSLVDEKSLCHELTTKRTIYLKQKTMVQDSSICLCFLRSDVKTGQTKEVVNYAKKQGLQIVNIAEAIKTYKENMIKTKSDPCKSEAYHFECDYTTSPKTYDTKNKLEGFYERFGIKKIGDPLDSTPKKVIPKDKEIFFKLRDMLTAYALIHHGKISATVDCEKWYAKIEVVLPFVEICTEGELFTLRFLSENVNNITISPTKDGNVRLLIMIDYFDEL